MQAAARLRRARLEQTWVPLPGERQNVFYEAHQGARRPATLQRVALIHQLHALFLRDSPDDPIAVAAVWLDQGAECESRGEHEQERVALTRAVELMRDEDPAVREVRGGLLRVVAVAQRGCGRSERTAPAPRGPAGEGPSRADRGSGARA